MSIPVRRSPGNAAARRRTMVPTRGKFECLESRFCMAVFYDFSVVASTGSGGIVDIEPAVSVNDHGAVAFVASKTGGQSIYFADQGGSPAVVSFAVPSSSRTYGRELQLNNANQIAAVDRTTGGTVGTRARLWDAQSTESFTILARGTSPNPLPGHFDILSTITSVSNDGKIVVAGLDTPAATWELHQSSSEIDVNDVFSEITTFPGGAFFRVLGADGDRSVTASRQGADTQIILRDIAGFDTFRTVASTTTGLWSELGVRVGLSDDGAMVAFYGNLTADGASAFKLSPGPGIFASIDHDNNLLTPQVLERVAGIAGNGVLDGNESFDDINNDGDFDAGDIERGIASFDVDSRVAIARSTKPEAAGTVFHVAWTGLDSIDSTNAIFASNLKIKTSGSAIAGVDRINAGRVIGVGQALPGLGVVSEVAIHDALNGQGQLAFWASSGGAKAIVLADPRPPKVVVVSTHGFGNTWNAPFGQIETDGFLAPWRALGNKFENLPAPSSEIAGEVASYVANWNSSDGWVDAALSLTASIVMASQGNAIGASRALLAAESQMARAGQIAEQAAAKILSDLKASGLLGAPELSQGGEQIIQLVGHSRGAAVNAQLAKLLADRNYRIQEYIALDGYSTDWPDKSGLLGDVSIVDRVGAVKSAGKLVAATNYRVQNGLADYIYDYLAPHITAAAATKGFVNQVMTAAVLAAVKNALPNWKAPERAVFGGADENTVIVGTSGPSHHLNIVDMYLGKIPTVQPYILQSYVGQQSGGAIATSQSPAADDWGMIAEALLAPSGFADGDFSRSDNLRQSIADLNLAGNVEPFLQLWGALQADGSYALGSYWQTVGPVELVTVEGNPVVQFSEAEVSSLSQRIYVPGNALSVNLRVEVIGAEAGDVLKAYFAGAEIGEIALDQVVGTVTLPLPASAKGQEGEFSLDLIGNGTLATTIVVDNLELLLDTPQLGADFNLDNVVDGTDFLLWQRGFGKLAPSASKIDGDADDDQDVDSDDLNHWRLQFGGSSQIEVLLAPAESTSREAAAPVVKRFTSSELSDLALTAMLASENGRQTFAFDGRQTALRLSEETNGVAYSQPAHQWGAEGLMYRTFKAVGANEVILQSYDLEASRDEWLSDLDNALEEDLQLPH